MIYKRKYLQFNELVLDSYDMLAESPHAVEFKGDSQEYSYGHGSYRPIKSRYMFAREQSVSLSIRLMMKKLPCEYREFYKQFAVKETTKPGKLWAIVNNEIVWAFAVPTAYSENENARRDEYYIELDLVLPEGVWHKANKQKTFLIPYDVCDFMDCKGYKRYDPCENDPLEGDCCELCQNANSSVEREDCSCCCDNLTKEMALCYHDDLQIFYEECTPSYQFVYDCRKAHEFFGDMLGQKLCTKDVCSNVIAGRIYSDTEIPTRGYEIVIDGDTKDPQITINGNRNVIKGEFEILYINSNGDVFEEDAHHRARVPLDPSAWVVPDNKSTYGWEFEQGTNNIIIDRGSCCGRACVYIEVDSLTI